MRPSGHKDVTIRAEGRVLSSRPTGGTRQKTMVFRCVPLVGHGESAWGVGCVGYWLLGKGQRVLAKTL